jgi:hypothetical protein
LEKAPRVSTLAVAAAGVSAAAILFPVGNSLAYALATFVRRRTHAAAVATFQTGGRCLVSAPRSSQQLTLLLINQSRASVKQRKASLFCKCMKTFVDFKIRKKNGNICMYL